MRPRYVRTITASTSAYWRFKNTLTSESENSALSEAKELAETEHHAQVVQKIASSLKQEEIETLTEQLTQLKGQFQQLNQDANTLAERYSRLEKYDRFKNRFQEILAERNELRVTKEKLQSQQRQTQQELHDLQQDRDRLLQK